MKMMSQGGGMSGSWTVVRPSGSLRLSPERDRGCSKSPKVELRRRTFGSELRLSIGGRR